MNRAKEQRRNPIARSLDLRRSCCCLSYLPYGIDCRSHPKNECSAPHRAEVKQTFVTKRTFRLTNERTYQSRTYSAKRPKTTCATTSLSYSAPDKWSTITNRDWSAGPLFLPGKSCFTYVLLDVLIASLSCEPLTDLWPSRWWRKIAVGRAWRSPAWWLRQCRCRPDAFSIGGL